ncbi:MAG TPA: FAD-dependent oxidoreductase [Terriglobia bacterium]|jgi:glycerol-3-phosphate dehydrogenase
MFDACIIGGGGVAGAAITRELALQGLKVIAIEKHDGACRETSGLNSRVIHSGFHEMPGTLKANLARAGSHLMIEYARKHGIRLLESGMLIAVPHGSIRAGLWREASSLWHLWRQGRRQAVPFRFILTPSGIRRIAPVEAMGGIFIPAVCIVEIEALVESVICEAKAAGAEFLFETEVTGITATNRDHILQTTGPEIQARILINSAGLRAHEVSLMAGGPKYEIEFIRGDYYELDGGTDRWGIRTLVYPAMPPHSRSKGIHFGPRTDGRLYIGPSATPAFREAPKEMFVDAARKFLPDIRETDLRWAYSGMRPKCGKDFTIRLERSQPPLVNLIGIDSPGLSSSMAIARHVAEIVRAA